MNMWKKFQKWWYFSVRNTIVRRGERGGFEWIFRRFTLEIRTKSGNWSAKWTADEHPYGYLLAGKDDENIVGFAQMMYYLGKTVTNDQALVDDIQKAFKKFEKRLEKQAAKEAVEDETEEKAALEFEKQVQEVVEMDKKERRKYDRNVDKRFGKAVKEVEDEAKG